MSAFVSSFKSLDDIKELEPSLPSVNEILQGDYTERKERPKFWSDVDECMGIAFAGCCSCVLFGHMKTLISREPNSWQIMCTDYKIGPKGFQTCLQMACCAAFVFPWPIGVSYTLLQQRRKLRSAYNEEPEQNWKERWCETASICCLWPCILRQHVDYVNKKHANNILLFEWETNDDVIRDKAKALPTMTTQKVAVLGPRGAGKTLFSRKLLQSSNSHVTGKANTIQVGYRPVAINSTSAQYLEVWDCPSENQTATERSLVLSSAHTVVLLYDLSNPHSFDELVDVLSEIDWENLFSQTKAVVVIGTKIDLVWKSKNMCDQLDSSMNDVKHKIQQELIAVGMQSTRVKAWCQEHNIKHIEVSSLCNFNMIPCLKLIKSLGL